MTAEQSGTVPLNQVGSIRRPPSSSLIVDANIILSVVLGRRSRPVFELVAASRAVLTSTRVVEEVQGVCLDPRLPSVAMPLALAMIERVNVISANNYASLLADASRALLDAAASRNGSTNDAHLLACAWAFDADIWSHDRDFAGTGWPSWSSANLAAQLGAAT